LPQDDIVEAVLHRYTLTIYSCPQQEKQVHGLTGRNGPAISTLTKAYCRLEGDALVIGIHVLDKVEDKPRLWESFQTRSLRAAVQALLILHFAQEISPRTPNDILARLGTKGERSRKILEDLLLAPGRLEKIRNICPPDAERVLMFCEKHGATAIFDSSRVRYPSFSNEQMRALASAINRADSTQEILFRLTGKGIGSFTVDHSDKPESTTAETEFVEIPRRALTARR